MGSTCPSDSFKVNDRCIEAHSGYLQNSYAIDIRTPRVLISMAIQTTSCDTVRC